MSPFQYALETLAAVVIASLVALGAVLASSEHSCAKAGFAIAYTRGAFRRNSGVGNGGTWHDWYMFRHYPHVSRRHTAELMRLGGSWSGWAEMEAAGAAQGVKMRVEDYLVHLSGSADRVGSGAR